ncbi:protein Wnt-10a-like [Lingula anatina]|uniref:Protein Wnt n=1 Tax=Lingula anatina TaxID=7574 RepID=A0A1S3KBZ0_LINAN|nr:protein Wnt-10a-like [Lingula anatina]|eukprot:XP_013420012.1 protein Wnt-10a-like [Lingula anatina]
MRNDILRIPIPTEPDDPKLDPNVVCRTYPDLTPEQFEMCLQYPDVAASAIQGIQIAMHECQHQFMDHRWNCSSLETKNKNPHSSPFLSRAGFRETAFAYAISAAGVTAQVAKACAMGKLVSCGCDSRIQGKINPTTKKWDWGGCSHNVNFGESFTEKFLDFKDIVHSDIRAQINLHNNRAGRLLVTRGVRTQCKCHGMSGSCELKTCWKATPPFRNVGNELKQKYHMATKVDTTNSAKGRLVPAYKGFKRGPFKTDLVYIEKSPTFCEPNPKLDSPGTVGRICNRSSTGMDNCDSLCCGRGYDTVRMKRTEKCDCKFHWCCYVICKTCTYNDWVTVCK